MLNVTVPSPASARGQDLHHNARTIPPRTIPEDAMLTKEENELLTRTDSGTPMGELLRRYWLPAMLTEELPAPDCPPVRVRLLGEDLVAFRDSGGQVGLLEAHCP